MSDSIMSGMWQSEGVAVAALVFAQTSLVLIVGLGLARLLRSRGPVVRSTILRAVLIAAVVGPAGSLGLAGFGVPGLLIIPRTQAPSHPKDVAIESATITPAVAGQHAAPVSQTFRSEPGSVRDSQVDASAVRLSAPQSPFPTAGRFEVQRPRAAWINGVVVTLWAAISGILLARLLIATVTVLRLRRRARPARASVCDLCDSISRQLGVRAPQVLVATGIPGPCLVGWLRPSILLPAGGEDAQREIFIHELAHVARRDCLWQLAAQVAAAPVWFQPLIWVMVGQMQRAAEEACDDRVMTLGGNCGTYVRTLADLAAMAQRRFDLARAGVGVVGMRSSAGRRIARLLATANSIPSHLGWRARSSIAMGAAIVVVAIAALRPQTRVLAEAPGPKAAPVAAEHVGRVIDADGKPVEGAQVWVFQSRGLKTHTLESTTTDADGKYAVAHAPSDSMEDANLLEAFAAGKGVGVVNYITTATREIQLRPPTSITLTITAPDDKPVSGLRVYPTSFVSTVPWRLSEGRPGPFWLFIAPPDLQKQLSGTTAADGTVTLHNLPQATQFELGFDDERFAFQGYDKRVKVSPDNPVSAPATVHLEAAATISGSVRFGPTGQPAAGVDVLVQGTHRNFSARSALATTDAEGRYRFTHIGPGEYNVVLELRDAMERDWTAVGHEWVKVAAGAKLDGMDFTLIKGGIVKGRVLAADTGQPITGKIWVRTQGPDHPRSSSMMQSMLVSSDGGFRFRVPPGVQYVDMTGLLPPAYHMDRQSSREVKVDEGQVVTVDFKLIRRAGGPVDGVVIGPDGKPAAGIKVQAVMDPSPFGDGSLYATSDAQGRFHFEIVPPRTPISVRDGPWGTAEPIFADQVKGVTIHLVRRVKLTLPGLVTDNQGRPIAGARVKLAEWFGTHGIGASEPIITGGDGRYEIPNLYIDSDYRISADADGYGEAQSKLSLSVNSPELPTLKLPRADATVGGHVIDETGKPVAGITVHLNNGTSPKEAVTNKEGRFSFHVVPGSHHLIWIRVKEQGAVGPHANGSAGQDDIRLVLPTNEQ